VPYHQFPLNKGGGAEGVGGCLARPESQEERIALLQLRRLPWKKLSGRDALLRVRDARLYTDAEHRVP
jgi:hypothetical protein